MKEYIKHLSLRIGNGFMHGKLHYIAKYEGRSANAHILFLIRKDIERFEKEFGVIELEEGNG